MRSPARAAGVVEGGERRHQLEAGDAVHRHRFAVAVGGRQPGHELVVGRQARVVEQQLARAGDDPAAVEP